MILQQEENDMFCGNCGKQIPDNTKFCNFCGAPQQIIQNADSAPNTAANQPGIADTSTEKTKKAPKKKKNIFIILAVALGAILIGKYAIAPSMVSDSGNNNPGNQVVQSQQTTNSSIISDMTASNPEYDAILTDAGIVHFPTFFNMETKNFVMKAEDGVVFCADYGYENDVIKQWVETLYIPVAEYTDDQKAEAENTFREQFAPLEALNCCTVTYKMGTNYLTITCTYSDTDQESNYAELYNAGILDENTFMSMSLSENNLSGQGFVKK